ncbi:MAG: hypothetical protein AAFR11_05650 [Pseudomonadota bacterium]
MTTYPELRQGSSSGRSGFAVTVGTDYTANRGPKEQIPRFIQSSADSTIVLQNIDGGTFTLYALAGVMYPVFWREVDSASGSPNLTGWY